MGNGVGIELIEVLVHYLTYGLLYFSARVRWFPAMNYKYVSCGIPEVLKLEKVSLVIALNYLCNVKKYKAIDRHLGV